MFCRWRHFFTFNMMRYDNISLFRVAFKIDLVVVVSYFKLFKTGILFDI